MSGGPRGFSRDDSAHYTGGAVILHWSIAAGILMMLPLGLFGASVETALGTRALDVHKVLGITILALTVVRILWRMTHRVPPLPVSISPMLKLLAHVVHMALYILLLVMPLSGWWMTSAFPQRHPILAGFFDIPFLPVPVSMASAGAAHEVHEIGGWVMIALAVLHIGAALKHHFIDRDAILLRMSMRQPN